MDLREKFRISILQPFFHFHYLAHSYSVTACVFSPLGCTLATGSQDCTVILWDIPSGNQIKTLLGHKGIVRCLTFSPNSRYLVSASSDETACVWDAKTWMLLRKLTGPEVGKMYTPLRGNRHHFVSGKTFTSTFKVLNRAQNTAEILENLRGGFVSTRRCLLTLPCLTRGPLVD